MPGAEDAANFFKAQNLQGPIFNNYDNGGYLVFSLNTNEQGYIGPVHMSLKPFVDNRPEAYPVSFFQNIYIPAQEDNAQWQQLDSQYHFNSIFFYYGDATPWGQEFLVSRVQDPNWAPVYADSYNIIFLRRDNPANAAVIKQFEIPKSRFGISAN